MSDALRSTKSWRKRTLPATVLRRRLLVSDSTGALAGSQTCGCTRACVLDFICTSGRRKRGHRFHEPGFGTGGSVDDKLDQNKTKQGVGLAAVPDEAARNLLSEINNVLVYLYWQYINKKSQKKNKNNQVKKL